MSSSSASSPASASSSALSATDPVSALSAPDPVSPWEGLAVPQPVLNVSCRLLDGEELRDSETEHKQRVSISHHKQLEM